MQPDVSLVGRATPWMMSIPHDVYYSNILTKLFVEEVWIIRAVCKLFYDICMEYFRNRLRVLVLHENAFLDSTFGCTRTILARCEQLHTLKLELSGCRTVELSLLNIGNKVSTLLLLLSQSNCLIKSFVLKNIPSVSNFPSITRNLQTVEEVVVDHVRSICVPKNIIGFNICNDKLHSLTLNLQKYDGADLPQVASTCSNLRYLDVSYSSQLNSEYLEAMLKKSAQLRTVYMCYVPNIKNTTVLVLQEYCTRLEKLCVQGSGISVDVLLSVARKRSVEIDVLDSELHLLTKNDPVKRLLIQT